MPRVSIGIPVYNGEKYLAETLDSLQAQTLEDFEIVISDNASTDRTAEICRAYKALDSRILYFRNPDPRYPETGWYLHIGDVTWSRVGDQYGAMPERVWSVPFVRVERPEGLIAASSAIDWGYIKANYTWEQLRTMREDWLDAALTAAST